jgi:type IV pilus assembly protein PilO
MPKYSQVNKLESLYRNNRLELENTIESLNILRDTLNKIEERKKLIFAERNLLFLKEEEIPIFYKDLSIVIKKNNIRSFEIKPGDMEDVKDLPENFPFKMQKLPIELRLVGNYNQFLDFFRDLYNQNYPISFTQIQLTNNEDGKLILYTSFDIYIFLGEGSNNE